MEVRVALVEELQPKIKAIFRFTRQEVQSWLDNRPYPTARKVAIAKALDATSHGAYRYHDGTRLNVSRICAASQVEIHGKDEPYRRNPEGTCKPLRIICARDDLGKSLVGPLVHPLDDAFFHSRYSVKHIPYLDRPRVLESRFGKNCKCLVIDYQSYESSQRIELMQAGEFYVYRALCSTAATRPLLECVLRMLGGETVLRCRGYKLRARTPAVRFSGEATTSLGNSINNLLCIQACLRVQGLSTDRVVVEGDDAIVAQEGLDVDRFCSDLGRFGLSVKCTANLPLA